MADDTLHVTGLTQEPAEQAPEQAPVPAAPPAESQGSAGEAQSPEQPADGEEVSQEATAQTPAAPGEQVSEGDGTPAPKKPSRGVQKALDRLTARAESAERIAQEAVRQRDAITSAVQQLMQEQQRIQGAQAQRPPDPTKFTNKLDFERAQSEFYSERKAQNVVGQFVHNVMAEAQQQAIRAQQGAIMQRYGDAMDKAPERFSDWQETVVDSPLPLPSPMLQAAIAASSDPAGVLHHIATNPQVYQQLEQMQPWQQQYELGRIVGQMTPRAVPSKAPPPGKPVGGKTSPASPPADDMTPAQHRALMMKTGQTRGLR
jgi:hypothetical protein